MAGIVGYISENIEDKNLNLITSMSNAIQYVGSDLIDQWSNGHLSISRVHHGMINAEKQPIFNEDKSMLIFMDGEVFGYETDKEYLLGKGHSFQFMHSDAEFILHLYEELGEEAFEKLNGSFLIAIYNHRTKELILVNDRFSSCPIFYYSSNKSLIFGAQLKAVLQSNQVKRNLDFLTIMEFLSFQKVFGNKTYYRDIKVLSPASILKFKQGKIIFKKYWEVSYKESKNNSEEYYIEALTDAIKKAVKKRTSDNHRYGILLSGGLDSRAILAASDCKMTAFTLADFENREVKIAKKIAESKGCKHIFLLREPDYYPDIVEIAVELGDGMWSFQHAHFTGFIDKIQMESDILFYGLYFDTLFKGWFLPRKKLNIFNKKIVLPVLANLSDKNLLKLLLMSGISLWDQKPYLLFSKEFCADVNDQLKRSVESVLNEGLKCTNNYYDIFEYVESHCLYRSFGYLNKICIKHFMDERAVSYDNDLLNMHLEIPYQLRFNGKVFKKALERLNFNIAKIPDANTGLPPSIPIPLEWGITMGNRLIRKIWRPKLLNPSFTQGSWPNIPELIRHNYKLKELILSVIHDEKCISEDIFNRSALIDMFNKHMKYEGDFACFLSLILTFGIWYKKYGPG